VSVSGSQAVEIPVPPSHLDLLRGAIPGVLSTLDDEGKPRSRMVHVECAGACSKISVTVDDAQRRDVDANPRISVLVIDPDDTSRFIEVRGEGVLISDYRLEVRAYRITLDAIHAA